MKNQRAVSLSINVLVVMAIALTVLLVLMGFFLGGFKDTGEAIRDLKSGSEEVARERNTSGEIKDATGYSPLEEISEEAVKELYSYEI